MKVNVEAILKDLDGVEIKDGAKVATLGHIAANGLLAQFHDEQDLAGEEKARRFELAARMVRSPDGLPIELSPEDAVLAKKCIGKAFGPLIVGQAFKLLNGDAPAPAMSKKGK